MTSWDAVVAAVGVSLGGERDRGRADLLACWQETVESEHGQRCVLAHYLADCHGDLDDEVAWDERALAAHAHLGRGDLVALGIPDAAGMAPSLHLNLGDGYLRQGHLREARAQLDAGLAARGALGQDGYGAMIRAGLEGLRSRLAEAELRACAWAARAAARQTSAPAVAEAALAACLHPLACAAQVHHVLDAGVHHARSLELAGGDHDVGHARTAWAAGCAPTAGPPSWPGCHRHPPGEPAGRRCSQAWTPG